MASIQGLDKLLSKLSKLGGNTNGTMKTAIHQAAKLVQANAKANAPVNDGHLRNSIYEEVRVDSDRIEGRVFTNLEYAPYVEFGTGPVGMSSDKHGLPEKVLSQLVYKQDGWWIHESQIDEATAEKYHFIRRETDQGVFYFTKGQPAQPFLYPAYSQNEKQVEQLIRKKLKDEIRKLAGGS